MILRDLAKAAIDRFSIKQVSADAHAALVCDGAGWHQTGQRLTVPDNVSLLRLPSYAPELNPIENVWQYLRANQLSRRRIGRAGVQA
jgi:transposase